MVQVSNIRNFDFQKTLQPGRYMLISEAWRNKHRVQTNAKNIQRKRPRTKWFRDMYTWYLARRHHPVLFVANIRWRTTGSVSCRNKTLTLSVVSKEVRLRLRFKEYSSSCKHLIVSLRDVSCLMGS